MPTRERPSYEVVVVGGGPAGMTTAIYATRLGHRTAVFEREGGRHARVSHVHNLYGVSEDVSGEELSKHAVEQLLEYGGDYFLDVVTDVRRVGDGAESDTDGGDGRGDGNGDGDGGGGEGGDRAGDGGDGGDGGAGGDGGDGEGDDGRFVVEAANATVTADRVVFATGFSDVDPPVPELLQFSGRGLFYCLHCDAYELGDAPVFVLGHDDHAAEVAMLLLNFTPDVDLLLDGNEHGCSDETARQLEAHPVDVVQQGVAGAFPKDERAAEPWLGGLSFADGTDREYHGGFAVYGLEYHADLPSALGCELTDEGAVAVDDRGETSVEGVYAVGDVTHGQNQTAVAIGDGASTGVALHKDLRRYPVPAAELDELEADDEELTVPAVADDLRARMRLIRKRESHAGLREPTPDR